MPKTPLIRAPTPKATVAIMVQSSNLRSRFLVQLMDASAKRRLSSILWHISTASAMISSALWYQLSKASSKLAHSKELASKSAANPHSGCDPCLLTPRDRTRSHSSSQWRRSWRHLTMGLSCSTKAERVSFKGYSRSTELKSVLLVLSKMWLPTGLMSLKRMSCSVTQAQTMHSTAQSPKLHSGSVLEFHRVSARNSCTNTSNMGESLFRKVTR
mmetsp:Transcript_135683/g.421545  ORF Transcript_135683/g.421545 Transcript_135683/m.421545 type:complete len:214 (+) Transcript_135683:493-1134(+)